ncbi:MAG: hypothetical protein NVV63_00635 [Opitutus sp.]|nr:hypothetical protein [Opitutus sp.]
MDSANSPKPFCTRVERAAYIDRRLAELYPAPAIPLDHKDAFTLLVAVLLSAHTTDKSVNKATPELFRARRHARENDARAG